MATQTQSGGKLSPSASTAEQATKPAIKISKQYAFIFILIHAKVMHALSLLLAIK